MYWIRGWLGLRGDSAQRPSTPPPQPARKDFEVALKIQIEQLAPNDRQGALTTLAGRVEKNTHGLSASEKVFRLAAIQGLGQNERTSSQSKEESGAFFYEPDWDWVVFPPIASNITSSDRPGGQ